MKLFSLLKKKHYNTLLKVILYDLECLDTIKLSKDDKYHLFLAKGNIKDLIKGNIKRY